MNRRERNELDRHITGNYGEDQWPTRRDDTVADDEPDVPIGPGEEESDEEEDEDE